jgi:hypothetical protein
MIMKVERIAPKAGYDTPEKQAYRSGVWDALLPAWELKKHDPRAHVVIMPSSEGIEIDHVISLGVPAGRIVAIDRSAAVIATSKWRKRHPDVKFFASEIGNVHVKISASDIVVIAANLDFCSNFCDDLVSQFSDFCKKVPQYPQTRFAVTVAKGREGKALVAMMNRFAPSLNAFNEPRLGALMACSGMDFAMIKWAEGAYTSGRVPMAWGVVSNNYVTAQMVDEHIEDIKKVEPLLAAKEICGAKGRDFTRRDAERWLRKNIAEPFMEKLEAAESGFVRFGLKHDFMGARSSLEYAFNQKAHEIWASLD